MLAGCEVLEAVPFIIYSFVCCPTLEELELKADIEKL